MDHEVPVKALKRDPWRASFVAAVLLLGCEDPFHPDLSSHQPAVPEVCASSADWLPATPDLDQFTPLPHPGSDCPFYRAAWQSFLIALQPGGDGVPMLLSYPTERTVFTPKQTPVGSRAVLGAIKQAGGRQILIDGKGNSIYYAIHVNQAFSDFIAQNGLQTAEALKAYPLDPVKRRLTFPAGVAEFKSAWQVVEGDDAAIAAQTQGFITISTTVPTLRQDPTSHVVSEDPAAPRAVTVRLLAIHVVFTLPGHPEFVWSSFEHSTSMVTGQTDTMAADGQRDVAPIVPDDTNPTEADPLNLKNTAVVSDHDFILYRGHTAANVGNAAFDETRDLRLDEASQKFHRASDGALAPTSIYRMFPASKSNTTEPDPAITSLNHNVEALFARKRGELPPKDGRGNYRLVGAVWLDKPEFFDVDRALQNDASSPYLRDHTERVGGQVVNVPAISLDTLQAELKAHGSDSQYSILGGEDRLSSTAMESFTQGPGSFNNCLTCHDTQAITANGIPLDRDHTGTPLTLLGPGLLNVSHVLSDFVLSEQLAGP
jgi:hypothetical protein